MTLSQNFVRGLSFFAAVNLALFSTVIVPTAEAAKLVKYYEVELQETAKQDQKIIRGTMISCSETSCRGKKTSSANSSMCAKIAQTFGPVKSFTLGDKTLDEAAITKCNRKA